jgi:hypothetical protein
MKLVSCIEELKVRNIPDIGDFTFITGKTYEANEVSEGYWLVDSIGVKLEEFVLHFEVLGEIEADKTSGSTSEVNKKFIEEEKEFREFLKEFGFKESTKIEENKESILTRIRDYIFA